MPLPEWGYGVILGWILGFVTAIVLQLIQFWRYKRIRKAKVQKKNLIASLKFINQPPLPQIHSQAMLDEWKTERLRSYYRINLEILPIEIHKKIKMYFETGMPFQGNTEEIKRCQIDITKHIDDKIKKLYGKYGV